jgi:hypothetical protein
LEQTYPGNGFKPHKKDIYNDPDLNIFYYWYPTGNSNSFNSKTKPTLFTQATVITNNVTQTEYEKATYCPSHLNNGGGGGTGGTQSKAMLVYYNNKIDSLASLLALNTDGGNTASVLSAVNTAQPAGAVQLRNMLIQKSPYLSDTVMMASVQKENVLTAAMVRDVLVQNPQSAKLQKIDYALDQRTDTLTAYMRAQIAPGRDTLGALELLRMQQAYYVQIQNLLFNKLYRFYTTDTVVAGVTDSLMMLYTLAGGIYNNYRLAGLYMQRHDTLAADSAMNRIAANYNLQGSRLQEYNNMQTLFAIRKSMLRNNLWLPDSSSTATLTSVADYGTGIPAVYARNMLLRMGAYSYAEPYLTVDTTLLKAEGNNDNNPGMATLFKNSCRLQLFPNPAGSYFTVAYNVPQSTTAVYLQVVDINGKALKTIPLYQTEDEKIIETQPLPSGLYTVSLFADGIKTASKKLMVVK